MINSLSQLAQLSESVDGRADDKNFDLIDLNEIYSKAQPRKVFEHLEELGQSMKELGQQQPIVVSPDGKGRYVIEQGERRYRAAKLVGLTHLYAVISRPKKGDSANRVLRQLAENMQRDDMKLYELSRAVKSVVDSGVPICDIAKRLGKKDSYISALNSVAELPPFLEELAEGQHIKDPVSLRRLKREAEVHPDEVKAQIEEWKKEAAAESANDEGVPVNFVITRAQVNHFIEFLQKLEGVDKQFPGLAKKKEEGEKEEREYNPGADQMIKDNEPVSGSASHEKQVPEEPSDEPEDPFDPFEPDEEENTISDAPHHESKAVETVVHVDVEGVGRCILTPGVVPPEGKISVMLLDDGSITDVGPDLVHIISVNRKD